MTHCYKLGGLNIVLDVCSGAVHVVDDPTFDIIERYETESRAEISDFILHTFQQHDGIIIKIVFFEFQVIIFSVV